MGNRPNKSSSKRSRPDSEKASPEASDRRDPLEVRTETFRVAAQRETVEAFVVAFILAFLFRAFLAEAFVIPTGSMAPTLMGAHKDLVCDQCGYVFQVGASRERSGSEASLVVVGGRLSELPVRQPVGSCERQQHTTFTGDRILVSKFTYTLGIPSDGT